MNLIHRLSVGQKLLLLGLLVLAAISVPLYLQLRQSQEVLAAAEAEREGVAPARKLMKLVQLTQQHRGLSAAFLGGKSEVQAAREAKKAEVDKALAELDADFKATALPTGMAQAWKAGTDDWRTLEAAVDGKQLSAAESSTKHAGVIARHFKTLDLLLDQSGLILDPQADTYYLITATLAKLPFATESLGQTRARGAGFLAEGKITPEQRAMMAGLLQQSRDFYEGMTNSFNKAFAANEALRKSLEGPVRAAQLPIEAALTLARSEVIAAENLQYPAPDYIKTFTQTIDGVFVLEETALKSLEGLLAERAHDQRVTQYVQFGLLGLLLVGIGALARVIVRSITEPLNQAVSLAERIAVGDLTGEARGRGRDEIAKLLDALARMRLSLRNIVGEVRGNAESVATASHEIAQGNMDLSRRTEQQASSLEETASSMEELAGTVRLNADHARQANVLAQEASALAQRGGDAVDGVIETMKGIDASSKRIADIIGVIDGIAFQTNILALNAAVEAARAGEQGRGFAVVAGEVRSLAQRSAEAAKEIKTLISASVEQVDAGSQAVASTGLTMQQAVDAIRRVAESIGQITHASSEQSVGLGQVSEAINHMDQLTQQNASLVEQSAAAAESLNEQATRLSRLVNTFRLTEAELAASAGAVSEPAPRDAGTRLALAAA